MRKIRCVGHLITVKIKILRGIIFFNLKFILQQYTKISFITAKWEPAHGPLTLYELYMLMEFMLFNSNIANMNYYVWIHYESQLHI